MKQETPRKNDHQAAETELWQERIPWHQPGWLEQACQWTQAQLGLRGILLHEPVEQIRVQPWSAVLRAKTEQGNFYFKASAPVLSHEPALTRLLYQLRPDCMVEPLVVDVERGWMLMPDEGPMLRTMIQTTADLGHWEKILPVYAGVQQEMIPRRDQLLEMGLLDRRLAGLPDQFARLLDDEEMLMIGQEDGLSHDQFHRLRELIPQYAEMCARLAGYQIPETLHHDDFHDANVFVSSQNGSGLVRYAFSDWGESCVAHPFFTMLVTLRSIAYRLDLPYGSGEDNYAFAPELAHLRDLYLKSWEEYGTHEDLRAAFSLAWRIAMVSRSLTWHRVASVLTGEERKKQAFAVVAWLQEFLDSLSPEARF